MNVKDFLVESLDPRQVDMAVVNFKHRDAVVAIHCFIGTKTIVAGL